MKKGFIFLLIVVFISFAMLPVWADTGPSTPENTEQESQDSGLITNIKELLQTLNELSQLVREWKEKGGWYYVFASTIGAMLDAALGGIEGVYGASYLYTPPLTGKDGHNWVYIGWNSVFFATIGFIALAFLMTIYKMWKGETEGIAKPLTAIGLIFVYGLVSYFSLWVIESVIYLQNYAFDAISRPQIVALYNEQGQVFIQKDVDEQGNVVERQIRVKENELSLKDIPGDMVLKAAFANTDIDLETLQSTSMSQIFLDEQNGKVGGLIGMFVGEGTQILLGLLALIRYIALRLLTIFVPAYINGAAIFGKPETYLGLGNILIRTIGLQAFFDAGWLVMIGVARTPDAVSDMGISTTLANVFILFIIFILAIIFWLIPFIKALKDPVTLGGDVVLKNMGKIIWGAGKGFEAASNTLGWVSSKTGSVPGERAGIQGSETARKMQEFGSRISNGEAGEIIREQMYRLKEKIGPVPKREENIPFIHEDPETIIETNDRYFKAIELPYGKEDEFMDKVLDKYPEMEADILLGSEKDILLVDKDSVKKVEKLAEEIYGKEKINTSKEITNIPEKREWKSIRVPESRRNSVMENLKEIPLDHVKKGKDPNQILIHPKSFEKGKSELKKYFKDTIPYWEQNGRYIVYQKGLPVLVEVPPKDGVYMGAWRKDRA
ncbi:hypothetical protein AN619_04940 [Thermotalea metallivorans]|uniref:Uncharacterized protein n=2 Tax=Thermotalea metallivorans TaxID=520762 RepID=A0A140L9Z3_9FIRM|nr:hypothetical protein AN619_04940 [Thermotalea metallivorans]